MQGEEGVAVCAFVENDLTEVGIIHIYVIYINYIYI